MLSHSLRASRQPLARAALRHNGASLRRTFIVPTAARKADTIQDMYLKELKAYKPSPVKPNDAEGQVQKFAMPKPPASPEEANLQNDLQSYEQQVPEVEGQASSAGNAREQHDWFVEEEEGEEQHAQH